jgi:hypothetical protein
MRRFILGASLLLAAAGVATTQLATASDHDDGETDSKARALNLTDHFAFRSPASPDQLSLIMYVNPRSLPGRQYFLSTNARYEFHVSRAASKTSAPTGANDIIFRFEASAPDASGVQPIKLTMLKNGVEVGSHMGSSTTFLGSKTEQITTNTASIEGAQMRYFIGQRQDSFHFDVVRFFQVRAFLAQRLFGGAGGKGDATATLADNCRGDKFLASFQTGGVNANEAGGVPDADVINLFNPPSCAPDFTKNLNVTAIVLNVPITALQASGETVFDTWSSISVPE